MLSRSHFVLAFFLLSFLSYAQKQRQPDFRLLISAGSLERGSYDAFYASPLFHIGHVSDVKRGQLKIEDASISVVQSENWIWFSKEKMSDEEWMAFFKNKPSLIHSGIVKALTSSVSFGIGIDLSSLRPSSFESETFRKGLGGVLKSIPYSIWQQGKIQVLAVALGDNSKKPSFVNVAINHRPAVIGSYTKTEKQILFVGRPFGSFATMLGKIDELKNAKEIPTGYVHLGDDILESSSQQIPHPALQKRLMKRTPIAWTPGRHDLESLDKNQDALTQYPFLLPADSEELIPHSRLLSFGNYPVQFSVVGETAEELKILWPKQLRPLSIQAAISKAVDFASTSEEESGKAPLVIGIVDSAEGLNEVLKTPTFDAVLALVSGRRSALPASDIMDLSSNHRSGIRPLAPLVRVSPSDVTEVLFWGTADGDVQKIEIRRYPLIESIQPAKDVAEQDLGGSLWEHVGLSNLSGAAWDTAHLNQILGGILLEETNSEIAIFEQLPLVTPIQSQVPKALWKSWVEEHGAVHTLQLQGKHLRKLFKQIKQNNLDVEMVVFGSDLGKQTIRKRPLLDNESYRIAVTEKALLAIYSFMEGEGILLGKGYSALMVQHALFEADKEPIKAIEAMRMQQMRADKPMEAKENVLLEGTPAWLLVQSNLGQSKEEHLTSHLFEEALGPAQHVLTFEIGDIDFGFNTNIVNGSLSNFQKASNQGRKFGIVESRLRDPVFSHWLLYANAGLGYSGPAIETKLSAKIKFYQANQMDTTATDLQEEAFKKRPAKDSVNLGFETRIPMERLGGKPILGFIVSPIQKLNYETQIYPNSLMTPIDPSLWPERVKDLRLFLGASMAPAFSRELFRIGGLVDYNIGKTNLAQAFGAGIEGAINYGTSIGPFGFKGESSLRYLWPVTAEHPDEDRLGLVWGINGKLELAVIGNWSIAAMVDVIVANTMRNPGEFATGTLIGMAISFGDQFKWIL